MSLIAASEMHNQSVWKECPCAVRTGIHTLLIEFLVRHVVVIIHGFLGNLSRNHIIVVRRRLRQRFPFVLRLLSLLVLPLLLARFDVYVQTSSAELSPTINAQHYQAYHM